MGKFFTIEELCKSETAEKKGIDNTPGEAEKANLNFLIEAVLDPVREYFGEPIVVTSGFRSEALNKAVGGSATSFHRFGCAADIRFNRGSEKSLLQMFYFIYSSLLFTELVAEEFPDGWVHVALQKDRKDERVAKYKEVGSKKVVKIDPGLPLESLSRLLVKP